MNLDDPAAFAAIDVQNMMAEIDDLPDQLQRAWDLGQSQPLPNWQDIRQVIIAGMGGSAIGADLLAAYLESRSPAPVFVHRDYGLPAWAQGPETLVIASSHSGNTEETLSSFQQAVSNRCKVLAVSTGGKLVQEAGGHGFPVWQFEHPGQPRAAVGYSFGLLLAALTRLGVLLAIKDPGAEVRDAVQAMRKQQAGLKASVPAANNPAKRMAGQLVDRWVTVVGSGLLGPVARRWKGQVNELAKAWAQFELLPEADHNTLAGSLHPDALLERTIVIFLRSESDHPRNHLRTELTRRSLMLEGMNTDIIDAGGDGSLAHQWTSLHFGDYTAYYLAMAYGVDPTPVDALQMLKRELGG